MLLELVRTGAIDPSQFLTQLYPITSVMEAYKAFDTRQPGWIKVELVPSEEKQGGAGQEQPRTPPRPAMNQSDFDGTATVSQ